MLAPLIWKAPYRWRKAPTTSWLQVHQKLKEFHGWTEPYQRGAWAGCIGTGIDLACVDVHPRVSMCKSLLETCGKKTNFRVRLPHALTMETSCQLLAGIVIPGTFACMASSFLQNTSRRQVQSGRCCFYNRNMSQFIVTSINLLSSCGWILVVSFSLIFHPAMR